ncbi:MAG TPA: amidohydrolase family protein [Dehalococcoidia bacterium]|nr:amidohydrolase family protein [Dehalococcoidia bacterium]
MARYDMVLRGGRVVDPASGLDAVCDLGIRQGRVAAVTDRLPDEQTADLIDVSGRVVIPGIIDTHVHIGGLRGEEHAAGHRMVAETGVTTCLDMGSPMGPFLEGVRRHGVGLNVAALFPVQPPHTIPTQDPSAAEIRRALEQQIRQGAFGLKLFGGHLPLTPDATARGIEVANDLGCYVAYHLGTTESSSNLTGLRELPALLGRHHVHLAHVSAYLRGMILPDPIDECREALDLLRRFRDQIISESYLSSRIGTGNATYGDCHGEDVEDKVTQNCLRMGGYPLTREGLRRAMRDGYAFVYAQVGPRVVMVRGEEAVARWEAAGTRCTVGFPVTPVLSSVQTTIAQESDGAFVVDAIATDGGAIPRNFLVERGLALVRLGALTLADYVRKVSYNPSRMLGLTDKGHFGEGADADVTVLDLDRGKATLSLVAGEPVLVEGRVVGRGGRLLTTPAGAEAAQESGLPYQVVDLSRSWLYRRSA